jgi:acyl-CoA oxidase
VRAGDIGPKYGWNSKDNGFVMFDKVRIPLDNMLMRNA